MFLTIGDVPQAAITIDPKDTLCQGQSALLSTDTLESGSYLWTPGNFTDPQITVDTSVTGGPGTTLFTLVATNRFGCSDTATASMTFRDCTAIDEPGNVFRFSATPNPCDGHFTIRIHTPVPEMLRLRLYSNNHTLLWSEEK